ncbi:MAG: hypothetical protein LWX56_13310 [Ignavibacteria bacterium]|nr:hypothetical protein [Ignavibacteria bacterium]
MKKNDSTDDILQNLDNQPNPKFDPWFATRVVAAIELRSKQKQANLKPRLAMYICVLLLVCFNVVTVIKNLHTQNTVADTRTSTITAISNKYFNY